MIQELARRIFRITPKFLLRTRVLNRFKSCLLRSIATQKIKGNSFGNDALIENLLPSPLKLLLLFPVINWESRNQRPQHIARQFRDDGYLVLYPTMNVQKRADSSLYFQEVEQGIYQLWLHGPSDLSLYQDTFSEVDMEVLTHAFVKTLEEMNPNEVVLFVEYPIWSPLVVRIKEQFPSFKLVYDCLDDHLDFEGANKAIHRLEELLIVHSQIIFASSQILFEKLQASHSNVHLVRNACDFNFFNDEMNSYSRAQNRQKIVGYFGAISHWFDEALVSFAAMELEDVKFVLVGSTMGADIQLLRKLPNVEFIDEIPYVQLPKKLASFDVAIIPFKIQPLTNATNPVKVYEYFSQGKAVVAVNLPELKALEPLCYVATSNMDFVDNIKLALSESNPDLTAQRIEFARTNQWSFRYHEIKNCLLALEDTEIPDV